MADVETKDEGPRSFLHLLQEIEYGACAQECSDKLFELGAAIRKIQIDRGGKVSGELTLKLKLSTDNDGPCQVHFDVAVKKPKLPRSASVFWLTKKGNLQREDPRQGSLPGIREVPKSKHKEREADDAGEAREVP